MVTSIAFSIPTGSVDYWPKRLEVQGIKAKEGERFGDHLIQFEVLGDVPKISTC